MSIRIDKEHNEMLDKLIARLILMGKKITKKELIGHLIETAAKEENSIAELNKNLGLEDDPLWIGLSKTHKSGIKDLSTSVDQLLYKMEEEE